ncbi:hypothetical protein SDC9_200819 [bioreactor metagenome]|uniref:Uncharacterized protein n=1 Tax=bioreactor metagenome TaxID=1076179 RepID=A0A645IP94_9ZZZZ
MMIGNFAVINKAFVCMDAELEDLADSRLIRTNGNCFEPFGERWHNVLCQVF